MKLSGVALFLVTALTFAGCGDDEGPMRTDAAVADQGPPDLGDDEDAGTDGGADDGGTDDGGAADGGEDAGPEDGGADMGPPGSCVTTEDCADGLVCQGAAGAAVCVPGCVIDDTFHAPDARDPAMACAVCAPATSTSAWSPLAADTVCRAGSGDLCDPDEVCDGTALACPEDTVAAAATECRASAGDCDVAEVCSGVASEACPADGVAPGSTICRVSAGPCDVADRCDGTSVDCPADEFRPATRVCRRAASCSTGPACPTAWAPASATCPRCAPARPPIVRPT